jgi:hypothetical protein
MFPSEKVPHYRVSDNTPPFGVVTFSDFPSSENTADPSPALFQCKPTWRLL